MLRMRSGVQFVIIGVPSVPILFQEPEKQIRRNEPEKQSLECRQSGKAVTRRIRSQLAYMNVRDWEVVS